MSIFRLHKSKNNNDRLMMLRAVSALLQALKIPATQSHIATILLNHPDFPSLLSVSETLQEWGVESEALKGGVEDLAADHFPAIVHLKSNLFAVLLEKQGEKLRYFDPSQGERVVGKDEFSALWSGVLLRAEKADWAGEPELKKHRADERKNQLLKWGLAIGSMCFLAMSLFWALDAVKNTLPFSALLAINTLGLVVSALMVTPYLTGPDLMKRICPVGKKGNCLRVMASPAGKIFGIPMADIGLVFFSGGFLTLMLSAISTRPETSWSWIALIDLVALPYTVFSVFYQAFVVRTWCMMCLVAQFLLWAEFAVCAFSGMIGFERISSALPPFAVVAGFALPLFFWLAIRPMISRSHHFGLQTSQLLRMRRNPDYIRLLLSKQEKLEMARADNELELGSQDAPIVLTMVVNPFCHPCKQALAQLIQLTTASRGKIKTIVRFLVRHGNENLPDREKAMDYDIALVVTALALSGQSGEAQSAFLEWFREAADFSRARFAAWRNKYGGPNAEALGPADARLTAQRNWAMEAGVRGTPTFFLNDIQFPREICLEDMRYFLLRQVGSRSNLE
jgi:uncharacterized membrane protein/thiol-disulfide isomerase/thioredoxin